MSHAIKTYGEVDVWLHGLTLALDGGDYSL
jgi:hypothetical protein